MAAAYASVVSVMDLVDKIQAYHLRCPIFVDTQLRQLESLRLKVSFLLDFLEKHSDGDARNDSLVESFECRIVDACYAVEDVIETYIVDDIHGRFRTVRLTEQRSKKNHGSKCRKKLQSKKRQSVDPSTKKQIVLGGSIINLEHSPTCFSQTLQKVTEYIDSIEREILVEIQDQSRVVKETHLRDHASSLRLLTTGMDTVVGLDDISYEIIDKLTGQHHNLELITITGMGGSGKSTLAKKVYDSKNITDHFDVCRWVTVSQQFNVEELLLGLLGKTQSSRENHQLGERLHKMLFGRRYCIVMDDIWSTEAWNRIRLYLPNNENGSRIIVTTRLLDLANDLGSFNVYRMNLLNGTESWSLLQKKVFIDGSCPPDLEGIGKEIAEGCKGLPLSIVAIGGVLAKSMNVEYWEGVAEDVSKTVNSAEDELCLKILDLSYCHLPIHLKPCFLYFGMFEEDADIRVSDVVRLWVAERFVKPEEGKSLEEVAMVYLKNLINRNLIFATEIGCTGEAERCKIHDLLRDLCLREGEKHRFLYTSKAPYRYGISQGFGDRRRIALLKNGKLGTSQVKANSDHLEPFPFLRSVICYDLYSLVSSDVKLLRVVVSDGINSHENWRCLVNSRYLDFNRSLFARTSTHPPELFYLFWNLETIQMCLDRSIVLSSKIWEMPQLRHVEIESFEIDDSCDGKGGMQENITVLENLQTLSTVVNFRCSEELLMKIPSVKELRVSYTDKVLADEFFKILSRMAKLESLCCRFFGMVPRMNISELNISHSLKKLHLHSCDMSWEDIGRQIGLLPHLQTLTLWVVKSGEEWNSVDDQFCSLKYLYIGFSDLVFWRVESSSFPCLEKLELGYMKKLEEIPCEIGEIPTVRSILLDKCSDSVDASAEWIKEEQKSFGNEDLIIKVNGKIL